MNGVSSSDLPRRAAMHAALGEPTRLAIAEYLSIEDCAPKELADRCGIGSNLLAHHIGVLEDAGLVRRRRSEGDGRRSYVQLALDDPLVARLLTPDAAAAALAQPIARVVFVCTHNSARSQLAAAAWQRVSRVASASAGTHPATRVHPRAVVTGRRHGLPLEGAKTTHFDAFSQEGDLIIAVCDRAHEELPAVALANKAEPMHWSVPDPVRIDTDAAFERAYRDISLRVERLSAVVTDLPDAPRAHP